MKRTCSFALVCCLLAASVLLVPAIALACGATSDRIEIRDAPANGVVIIEMDCPFGCRESLFPPQLEVRDQAGVLVKGHVAHSAGTSQSGWHAWRPDDPLTPGAEYELTLKPPARDDGIDSEMYSQSFMALSDADWLASDIVIDARLSMVEDELSDSIECGQLTTGCGSSPKHVPLASHTRPTLEVQVELDHSPLDSEGQYTLTWAFWSSGEARPPQVASDSPLHLYTTGRRSFEDAASSYCYRVEIFSLVDGSRVAQEDCFAHGSLGELTTRRTTDDELLELIAQCESPPDGMQSEWCSAKRGSCDPVREDEGYEDECAFFAESCDSSPSASSKDEPRVVTACASRSGGRSNAWLMMVLASAVLLARARVKRPIKL